MRQHRDVLHAVVAQGFDDSRWPARSSAERRALRTQALEKDRGPVTELDALGKRTLAVFDAIMQGRHRYGADAIGYFIVSNASGADDMLAALLLARWAAAYDKRSGEVALDIAPQFENAAALGACGATLRQLLADPLYRRHLEARGRRQCVLIGYSDSNKELGACASRVTIHQAQNDLAQVLDAAGERPVLFHARGGAWHGAGPHQRAPGARPRRTAAHPAAGRRWQGWAAPDRMRTLSALNALSLVTAACRRGRLPPEEAADLEIAALLAETSRAAYRRLVYEAPQFYDFFQAVTPIDVIERMQIGARSVHRTEDAGIEGLLPVPWVFAWSQTRYMLPGWFGAGVGLGAVIARFGLERLREVCGRWFFLRNLVDDVGLRWRADLDIAEYYTALVPQVARLAAEIAPSTPAPASRCSPSAVRRSCRLDPTLQRSIRLRNPTWTR